MRKATEADFAQLRDMTKEYEALTGKQGYLYCTQPVGTDKFIFGDGQCNGIENALRMQRDLLDAARAGA